MGIDVIRINSVLLAALIQREEVNYLLTTPTYYVPRAPEEKKPQIPSMVNRCNNRI
ncbi:hypothetical protein [Edwardsiella ictaluri]|uniref:hypothetical protein n=1 Tax=Edwardsiella ictaluri TaxID=67780 RepID=UPI0018DB2487|nr:hypothetical protein [Edwardsiella ictaluri]QPW29686.1 hypothetical protein F8539_06450 [Edwardsiella ictaluri]